MQATTQVANGLAYQNNARLFDGSFLNNVSSFVQGVAPSITGMGATFMQGLTGMMGGVAQVVGAGGNAAAQVVGQVAPVLGNAYVGAPSPLNPSPALWDDETTTINNQGSNKTAVIAMVAGGVVLLLLLVFMFKKK
jgi:hypothetical protein